MQKPNSKVIQISTTYIELDDTGYFVRNFLCEDGSVWEMSDGNTLECVLEALPQPDSANPVSEWRTIKSAPKYKTDIGADKSILLLTKEGQIVEGYWTPNGKEWITMLYCDDFSELGIEPVVFNSFKPTHWMPKPPTPIQKG